VLRLGDVVLDDLERVHGRDDHRLFGDQAGFDKKCNFKVRVPRALPDPSTGAVHGDAPADHNVDRLHLIYTHLPGDPGRALLLGGLLGGKRQCLGVEQVERLEAGHLRHGHVDALAILQGADPHRQLRPVGIGLDDARLAPLVQTGKLLRRCLRTVESRNLAVRISRCAATIDESTPHPLAYGLFGLVDLRQHPSVLHHRRARSLSFSSSAHGSVRHCRSSRPALKTRLRPPPPRVSSTASMVRCMVAAASSSFL